MKNNISAILWFFAALGFISAGIIGKNTVFTILGLGYICIGIVNIKKKNK